MTDQQPTPAMEGSLPDKNLPPNMVPYERFAEVNRQLKALKAELANFKLEATGQPDEGATEPAPVSMEDIYKRMVEDPEGYLSELMARVVQHELEQLREEMELKSALRLAGQKYPEFKTFQNYILQEIAGFVQEDPEVDKLSWEEIIDKGMDRVQTRFKNAVQSGPGQLVPQAQGEPEAAAKPMMESGTTRKPQPVAPSFTRDEIASMSLEDFMKNEALIDEALRSNRIR